MLFKDYCKLTQKELKKKLIKKLGCEVHDGFLYRAGSVPILLVAHMDTVHAQKPRKINDELGILSSPQGIGGDDRCGIYMINQIIKQIDCHVLFTEDEEIGGIGARKFAKSELCKKLRGTFNYIIEFDRKGYNDAVFYECGNDEFKAFVTKEFYKEATGSYSDICDVAPALDASAVNLSCGYYKAHTTDEYVVMREMMKSIAEAINLIKRTTEEDKFEWIEEEYDYSWSRGFKYATMGFYNNANLYSDEFAVVYEENGEIMYADSYGETEAEVIGNFLMNHEQLTFSSIIEIYSEAGEYVSYH